MDGVLFSATTTEALLPLLILSFAIYSAEYSKKSVTVHRAKPTSSPIWSLSEPDCQLVWFYRHPYRSNTLPRFSCTGYPGTERIVHCDFLRHCDYLGA